MYREIAREKRREKERKDWRGHKSGTARKGGKADDKSEILQT